MPARQSAKQREEDKTKQAIAAGAQQKLVFASASSNTSPRLTSNVDDTKSFFDGDCLAHQYHLLSASELRSVDLFLVKAIFPREYDGKFKYYSHLAALCHIIRDNQEAIYSCWRKEFPHSIATNPVWKICPRPIAGRWGRKSMLEDYILRLDIDTLDAVLRIVLEKRDYFKAAFEELGQAAGANAEPAAHAGKGAGRGGRGGRRGREEEVEAPARWTARRRTRARITRSATASGREWR